MSSSLGVDPGSSLLSVSSSGENDVSVLSTSVSVVTLVDYESVARDGRRRELVGTEKVDEFGFGRSGGRGRSETDIVSSCSGSSL